MPGYNEDKKKALKLEKSAGEQNRPQMGPQRYKDCWYDGQC